MMDREVKSSTAETRVRRLTVSKVAMINPAVKRITFAGPELADIESLSPEDHVKVFFPLPGEEEPRAGSDAGGGAAPVRDYALHRFSKSGRSLDIDFALHDEGPGADWARQAVPGQIVLVSGPHGR